MRETIRQLGVPLKDTEKFEKHSGDQNAHFIFPFSLINFANRPEDYKAKTRAKIAAYLAHIKECFPKATVEFLLGDTLRQAHGGAADNQERLTSVLEFLGLEKEFTPPEIQFTYGVQHTFEGLEDLPKTWDIKLSSWDKYLNTKSSTVPGLMNQIKERFAELIAKENNPQKLYELLADDKNLYSPEHFGFVEEYFFDIFSKFLGSSGAQLESFRKTPFFITFMSGFSSAAVHHIKKTHDIKRNFDEFEDNHPGSKSSQKKLNILNELQNPQLALQEFMHNFSYILEETAVIFNILSQLKESPAEKKAISWMIYPEDLGGIPHYHPLLQLNKLFEKAHLNSAFLSGGGFLFPYSNKDHKIQSNSNGSKSTMKAASSASSAAETSSTQALQMATLDEVGTAPSSAGSSPTDNSFQGNLPPRRNSDPVKATPQTQSTASGTTSPPRSIASSQSDEEAGLLPSGGMFPLQLEAATPSQEELMKIRLARYDEEQERLRQQLLAEASKKARENPKTFGTAVELLSQIDKDTADERAELTRTYADVVQSIGTIGKISQSSHTSAPVTYARPPQAPLKRADSALRTTAPATTAGPVAASTAASINGPRRKKK